MNLEKFSAMSTDDKLNFIAGYTLLAAKNVLDISDASLYTGLSKSYLYRLTCEKKIPFSRPNGKQIYFAKEELDEWLLQNRMSTIKEAEQKAINYVVTGKMKGGR